MESFLIEVAGGVGQKRIRRKFLIYFNFIFLLHLLFLGFQDWLLVKTVLPTYHALLQLCLVQSAAVAGHQPVVHTFMLSSIRHCG